MTKCENLSAPTVYLSESRDEWKIIRECYVKSFFNYPLYKYIEPDPLKREKFLRAYMDANYDVAVEAGEGIVLAVRIPADNKEKNNAWKTIGGALLVPPSIDGCGWAVGSDEPYWEAYEKYGLRKISKEGMERVKRYEAWENEHVAQKASATCIPLWNGLFCAIDPAHASRGVGSLVYKLVIKIMARHWFKLCERKQTKDKQEKVLSKVTQLQEERASLKKIMRTLSFNHTNHNQLFMHKSFSQSDLQSLWEKKPIIILDENSNETPVLENERLNREVPLLVAVSHCERSARFHRSNGFHPISKMPFHDPKANITPFNTSILVLDPFSTGKIKEFVAKLNS